jgi:DNA-directed RNA polymerase sigma subunit (sigma70/sigma32)
MKKSIDLGLAISGLHVKRGVGLTHHEIAAFCDCSWQRIWQIEQRALHKLRQRLRDPITRERY